MTSRVTRLFQQGGGLSDTLSNFELRPGQVELVDAIENAVANKQHLIAEAGTGIGKTFSYLLPTLAQGKKVFVSTATKHLQDQVFFKDLPIVEKVLGRSIAACLLKGRNNYFCHYRFEEFATAPFSLNKKLTQKVAAIRTWSEQTLSGDLSEVAVFTDEDIGFKKRVTSTTDNCLGGECPYFEQCFLQKAREKAKQSEVVIVNHALLMADIVLKETGFAEILPEVDVVVIDEAHHLPKVATQAFAEQFTGGQLIELAKDALQVYQNEANDLTGFTEAVSALVAATEDFSMALADYQNEGQIPLSELKQLPEPYQAFKTLMQSYKPFLYGLETLATCSQELSAIYERAMVMAERIKMIFSVDKQRVLSDETIVEPTSVGVEREAVEQNTDESPAQLTSAESVAVLQWNGEYFQAARLPIHLGSRFRDVMQIYASSWVFVSATLSVNERFDFFTMSMGISRDIRTLVVTSPFDYASNAVVYVADYLPNPNEITFVDELVEMSQAIIKKVGGRTFMLFTSYRNMYKAATLLEDSGFNLFIQGEMPKSQLIDAFIQADNAVLLGTVSFWEGVDVAGENLSCVIIDKIPFPSPGDPMIAEQSRYLESQGKSAFAHCYMPRAATLLKQGAGRLIRSAADKGVLIFGDVRMLKKSYGQQLLNSMPPAKRVDYNQLMTFIEEKL